MSEQIQSVIIRLMDGRQLVYSGPVQVVAGTPSAISSITFTTPKDLPDGYSLEILSLDARPVEDVIGTPV